MKAPVDVFRDGACGGDLSLDGDFLVYRRGDPVLPADEAAVRALRGGPRGVGDSE